MNTFAFTIKVATNVCVIAVVAVYKIDSSCPNLLNMSAIDKGSSTWNVLTLEIIFSAGISKDVPGI